MFKAGASNHDKVRIRDMVRDDRSVDEIVAITRIHPDHVRAIVKQVKAGKLQLIGHNATGQGREKTVEQELLEDKDRRIAELEAQLAEQGSNDEPEETKGKAEAGSQEGKDAKPPANGRRKSRSNAA